MTKPPEPVVTGELKPCPFCDAPLAMRGGVNPYGRCDTPDCWACERKISVPSDDPRQVAQWNSRTAHALPGDVGEGESSDPDLDRHIFAWFNDRDCDEMRACLDAYDAHQGAGDE